MASGLLTFSTVRGQFSRISRLKYLFCPPLYAQSTEQSPIICSVRRIKLFSRRYCALGEHKGAKLCGVLEEPDVGGATACVVVNVSRDDVWVRCRINRNALAQAHQICHAADLAALQGSRDAPTIDRRAAVVAHVLVCIEGTRGEETQAGAGDQRGRNKDARRSAASFAIALCALRQNLPPQVPPKRPPEWAYARRTHSPPKWSPGCGE